MKNAKLPLIYDGFNCFLPQIQAHVKHCLIETMLHICLVSPEGHFPSNVEGEKLCQALGTLPLLYTLQSTQTQLTQTKLTHITHTTINKMAWCPAKCPIQPLLPPMAVICPFWCNTPPLHIVGTTIEMLVVLFFFHAGGAAWSARKVM